MRTRRKTPRAPTLSAAHKEFIRIIAEELVERHLGELAPAETLQAESEKDDRPVWWGSKAKKPR